VARADRRRDYYSTDIRKARAKDLRDVEEAVDADHGLCWSE
jgi:hypothetical protein